MSRLKSHGQTLQSSVPVVSWHPNQGNMHLPNTGLSDNVTMAILWAPGWFTNLAMHSEKLMPSAKQAMIPKEKADWQAKHSLYMDYWLLTMDPWLFQAWRDSPCVGQSSGPKPVPKEMKQHWISAFFQDMYLYMRYLCFICIICRYSMTLLHYKTSLKLDWAHRVAPPVGNANDGSDLSRHGKKLLNAA